MFWNKKNQGRIFISYRRSDTQGFAGRLSDSLENYFGGNKVFRDIEDIRGGSDFAKDIDEQLRSSDAVIVLIGPEWLESKSVDGKRRIDDPNDWVFLEIATAIEKGLRLFPVLVEGASLPARNQMPEKLHPVLNYNAISLSDHNWDKDVLNLGKIISFDIPTTNERLLFWLQILVYFSLGISLCYTTGLLAFINNNSGFASTGLEIVAIPFYVILAASLLLPYAVPLIDREKQKFMILAVVAGVLGSAFFFFGLKAIDNQLVEKEKMFVYFGSIMVSFLMISFLSMSGFKSR